MMINDLCADGGESLWSQDSFAGCVYVTFAEEKSCLPMIVMLIRSGMIVIEHAVGNANPYCACKRSRGLPF